MPKGARRLEFAERYNPFTWFKWGALVLLALTLFSTLVYYLLGVYYQRPDWSVLHCLFMVVITLTTIGYGDWLHIKDAPLAQIYTMLLAMMGVAVPAFVISNVTGLIVEGLFSDVFRRRRMTKTILDLSDHVIVCGAGTTGYHCIEELVRTHRPLVVIDRNETSLRQAVAELGEFPYVIGSADDDEILRSAGVTRAMGLITCLTEDKDNLYVALSARQLNPKLRIVSKAIDEFAPTKLKKAGADRAVNTTAIGGLRLVSELVRPTVVTFLDAMLRDHEDNYRFEELTVESGARIENETLAKANLRRYGDVLVVAARAGGEDKFKYNPKADLNLTRGTTVVFLGRMEDLLQLHPLFRGTGPQTPADAT